jgi:hypothetical protein
MTNKNLSFPFLNKIYRDSLGWMELADNYCEFLESSAYCYLYDSVTDALFQTNKVSSFLEITLQT